MKYEILAIEGTEGVLPNEGIEYSVKSGRIVLTKNGEKIIDDEYKTGPDIKYIIDGEEIPMKLHEPSYDKDIEDSDDVEEYNVANMLPQGMGAKASLKEEMNLGPDLKIAESEDNVIDYINFDESVIDFIKNDEMTELGFIDESIHDTIINMKTKVNVSNKIRRLIVDIAILKAKLKVLSLDNKKNKLKIIDIKKDIIDKEKEKREIFKSSPKEVIDEVNKLEKEAEKEAEKEVAKDKDIKESVEDVLVQESFFSKAKKYEDKLKTIQKEKPERYDDVKKIDEFLSKHMDDIKEVSDILDKEADEINENNVKTMIVACGGIFVYFLGLIITIISDMAFIGVSTVTPVPVFVAIGAWLVAMIASIVGSALNYFKTNDDWKMMNEMIKIKDRLSKISKDNTKLPKNLKERIDTVIDHISDAEVKYQQKVKTSNVSESTSLLNSYLKEFASNNDRINYLKEDTNSFHKSEINGLYEENGILLGRINYFLNEAANIESEIKPIIDELNKKGYKTKYSSPGHSHLRKKDDKFRDGTYYNKLYSDARIMFDGKYNFPSAPKYWMWKNVDGNDYLDVIPLKYDEKDGTPDEAFNKWKTDYMNSLKEFVSSLKSADSAKGDDNGPKDEHKSEDIKEESVTESTNDMIDNMIDLKLLDLYD